MAKTNERLATVEKILSDLFFVVKKSSHEKEECQSFLPVELPCKEPSEIEKLENWIKEKEENATNLVHWLARCGGGNVRESTRSMLKKLFDDNVAVLYNWTGKVPSDPNVKKKQLNALRLTTEVIPRLGGKLQCDHLITPTVIKHAKTRMVQLVMACVSCHRYPLYHRPEDDVIYVESASRIQQ